MPFSNDETLSPPVQRKISKLFIHLSGIRNDQDNTEKSSLVSYSSNIETKGLSLNKRFGNYMESEMKRPPVNERGLRRISVSFKQITEEDIMIRQLIQQGFLLIMSICQLKYADTLQTESWYFNGSVLYCSLHTCLHKIGATFSETTIFIFLRQIYYTLEYIHQNGLIHGNITSHAIRIMDNYTAKLSNFEYMHVKERKRKWPTGDSWRWMSPETLLKEQSFLKSDIFSFCCVCLEYFSNCLPWDKCSKLFVKKHYTNGNLFPQDNFSVPAEIKECFSDGLATKKHERKLNFRHFETVMKLRASYVYEYNLDNFQINLSSPNVSETRYSNQTNQLNQQQLDFIKASMKSIHTNICPVVKNKKSEDHKASNSSNENDFDNIQVAITKSDSVKFLINYFEDRSSPISYFNLKNLRRRTISSWCSTSPSPPEKVQVSKALLLMKNPGDMKYIRNISKKTPLQNLTGLEKLETPKNTSLGIVTARISYSDIGNQTKRPNNLVYLRRQSSVSQKLSFKCSSTEKFPFSEPFATSSSFVSTATEHFDVERDFFENCKMLDTASFRRQSFPVEGAASKRHYLKPNEDYNGNLNNRLFLQSSDKTSFEQRPETNEIQKAGNNPKRCTFKDYVKSQVNKWEKPVDEHLNKSQPINFKDYKYYSKNYVADKDIHWKINSWEEKKKN